MDKISIIVPIYNVEKYLEKCINSIINQTYRELEIILVDDGSTDGCPNICDEYKKKDERIKVIHKENGGLSDARNVGIENSTGRYICFIDSDDIISSKFVEILYGLCLEYNADIVECDYIKFNEEKEIQELRNSDKSVEIINNKEMMRRLYNVKTALRTTIVCNKLYKSELFSEIKFPKGKLHEDEFTTYKIIYKSNITVVINQKLYFYRKNNESIMGKKFNEKRYDALIAFNERKEFFKKNNDIEFYNKSDVRYQNKIINFYCLTRKYIEDSEKKQKELIKLANDNFKKMDKSIRYKFKFIFFKITPNIYYYIWKNLRKKYNP